jgi:hypothetical protein
MSSTDLPIVACYFLTPSGLRGLELGPHERGAFLQVGHKIFPCARQEVREPKPNVFGWHLQTLSRPMYGAN